jgi:hypothetical protein
MVWVYCIVEADSPDGPCKIGVATNLTTRFSSIQCGNWRELKIAWSIELSDRNNALNVESHILSRLRPNAYGRPGPRRRLKSEWVDASPDEAMRIGEMLIDAYQEEAA